MRGPEGCRVLPAYNTLRERFPTWEEVREAPVHEVSKAIQIAGLNQTKAPRIHSQSLNEPIGVSFAGRPAT